LALLSKSRLTHSFFAHKTLAPSSTASHWIPWHQCSDRSREWAGRRSGLSQPRHLPVWHGSPEEQRDTVPRNGSHHPRQQRRQAIHVAAGATGKRRCQHSPPDLCEHWGDVASLYLNPKPRVSPMLEFMNCSLPLSTTFRCTKWPGERLDQAEAGLGCAFCVHKNV
jgi:hypothetical protein